MRNILKNFFVIIISFFLFSAPSLAIVCEYPEAGLNITYDENSKVTVDQEKFQANQYYQNLLALVKWGSGKYNTGEIEIDQTLFEKYQGYSCPSGMYVCEYGNWSLSLFSITSLGLKVADIFTQIPCWTGDISSEACEYMNEEGWALLTLGEKRLYIYTQEEYEKSDLPKYEGGLVSDDLDQAALDWYDACSGGSDEWYAVTGGSVCWLLGGVLEGVVWETLVGDGIDLLYYRYANCDVVEYSGQYASFNVNCGKLKDSVFSYIESISEYTNCGEDGSCKSKTISEINQKEDNIKSYCSQILQSYDYGGSQKECVEDCLKIKEILNEHKKGTDLYDDGSNLYECGFSERLLVWASNILRWIKYILPVAVIIFGMLDFIKAIGADKDDEMKKAQKRFIIRLIAAALVFIIPLILEFVLDKMGFGYNDCGLF